MSDDELDFNLVLCRKMMREHARFASAHGGTEDLRKIAMSEFKWWYVAWSWTLHEMKQRG